MILSSYNILDKHKYLIKARTTRVETVILYTANHLASRPGLFFTELEETEFSVCCRQKLIARCPGQHRLPLSTMARQVVPSITWGPPMTAALLSLQSAKPHR